MENQENDQEQTNKSSFSEEQINIESLQRKLDELENEVSALKKQFFERTKNRKVFSIVSAIITFIIVIFWIKFIFCDNNISGNVCGLYYNFLLKLSVHLAFFVMLLSGIFITYKTYLAQHSSEDKENELKRKEEWEQSQYELNKKRKDTEEIKNLKKEKCDLEKELKKFKDTSIAERERNIQSFHLLALALSNNNIFSDNQTIEEKLKQIEKDYELLKKTITEIKL